MKSFVSALLAILALSAQTARAAQPIEVRADISEAGRRLLHTRVTIPCEPGPLTLYFPKWIPGTHSPAGPISDQVGFTLSAAGKPIEWRRDEVDVYAIHAVVPAGTQAVEVAFDLILPGLSDSPVRQQTVASAKLVVLNWCDLLVYPKVANAMKLPFRASLKMPAGWNPGTALPTDKRDGDTISFGEVTLETLIDSPTLCGQHTRDVPIGPAGSKHRVFMACDSEAGLDVPDDTRKAWDRLVIEGEALFGSRPYGSYTFLLALTDKVRPRGLEHHESSDNRIPEMGLTIPAVKQTTASLLPHEFVHAWNGKFRRPAGMITPDFQQTPKTKMLWVYEGLTNYLGWVLAARSGLLTLEQARDGLAVVAERMRNAAGRKWRPLEDTAAAAHILADSRGSWSAWRRSVDYYDEGTLIWLEADVIIRRESQGKKSLDDFCRAFFACQPGRPEVKGYELEDVVKTLNTVVPYDWSTHLVRRVSVAAEQPPLDGILQGGWILSYGEKPTEATKASESYGKSVDLSSSIGLRVSNEGTVGDVIPESPAAKAGVGPGMKLVAVNGRKFTPDQLRLAVAGTKTGGKLELLIENGDFFATHPIAYTGGARYARLERVTADPDRIGEILKPRGK